MDHAEVQELLDQAAAEPGGFDRLMAGDTAEAAAVAGHLAGCASCAGEMERLRRTAGVIRDVVRSTAPPDLRDRTLAYVGAVGRPRGAAEARRAAEGTALPSRLPAATRGLEGRRRRVAVLVALAASLIVAVAGTAAIVGGQRADELGRREAAIRALERITGYTVRVSGEPDVRRVALVPADAGGSGTVLFSPRTRELVIVTSGLPRPPAGRELRCWVEIDGQRTSVARMFVADGLAFWAGEVDAVAGAGEGARFGVTLVEAGGGSLDGEPVISGEL